MHRLRLLRVRLEMLVFIDFEASSLAKRGYPIEVAWVFEDNRAEAHLIRPAPGWDDWDPRAEAIHGLTRATLLSEGTPHDRVAQRMIEALGGHDLTASAPSWDGKWLSALLRAAGLPRHSLRLRATEAAQREVARGALQAHVPADALDARVEQLVTQARAQMRAAPTAHRALADARAERDTWCAIRDAAGARA